MRPGGQTRRPHRAAPVRSAAPLSGTANKCSGTPLPRKLGIKQGHRVALLGAPDGFALGELPDGVQHASAARAAPPT